MRLLPGIRGTSSGFTLIELMVVLVLIGVLTALLIPEMKGTYEDALLRSTARKLVRALQMTSSQAITGNESHRLRLVPEERTYRIERRARPDEPGHGMIRAPEVPESEGTWDRRVSVDLRKPKGDRAETDAGPDALTDSMIWPGHGEPNTISFAPDGTAEAAEIRLRDRQGFELLLRVDRVTGRVRVREPEAKE